MPTITDDSIASLSTCWQQDTRNKETVGGLCTKCGKHLASEAAAAYGRKAVLAGYEGADRGPMMADDGIQRRALRFWCACALLCVAAGFEIFLDAPRDLMMATVAAFILCGALFTLHVMLHMGWRTYDIIRFVIIGGLFVFIFTRPYPTHWLIAIFLVIWVPLNLIYPDRAPGADE